MKQTGRAPGVLSPLQWVLIALHFSPALFLSWALEGDWSAKSGISELLLMEREPSSLESKRRQSSWRWILLIPFPARGQDNISVIDMTLWIMERGSRRLEHLFHVKNCWGQSPVSSSLSFYCRQEAWVPGDWGCGRCSVAKLCTTLCDPMNCSTPGFPVLQYLPEFVQTHVLWVSDAIQPSHPLSPPSPLALNLSQHQSLSQWVSYSYQMAKVLGDWDDDGKTLTSWRQRI